MISEQEVYAALKSVRDPELNHDIVELGLISQVVIEEGVVYIAVMPTTSNCPFSSEIEQRIERKVAAMPGVERVEVQWGRAEVD
jgi:ATP-binding protein involved in chromosome partitioning